MQEEHNLMLMIAFGGARTAHPSAFSITPRWKYHEAGTSLVKFKPFLGLDTMHRSGVSQSVQTKHFCISAMQTYSGKSLEVCEFVEFCRICCFG